MGTGGRLWQVRTGAHWVYGLQPLQLRSLRFLQCTLCSQVVVVVEPTRPLENIVETAVGNGMFMTLVAAVKAAGLVEALSGPGPLTVFAPTDDAFAKLGKATIDSVLADKALLTKILTYHVVSGQVMAADVVKLTSAKTLQGGDVKVAVVGGAVKINDATVVVADVLATNGVIHVIDTVLLPS